MSLSDETRTELLNLYIEKAYSTLADAESAIKIRAWGMAANRLYYALFHATSALLVCDGIPVGSHRGIKALFGQHYILQGKFTPEHSKVLSQMETLRDKADYNIMFVANEEDVVPNVNRVKKFIDDIVNYVMVK